MMREQKPSERLERLWEAYRQATPEPGISPNFMPELWARIDAARPVSWVGPLEWLAARVLPVAVALTLAMSAYIWIPNFTGGGDGTELQSSYVDALTADMLEQQRPPLWVHSGEDSI
jgi:hypothetical protein